LKAFRLIPMTARKMAANQTNPLSNQMGINRLSVEVVVVVVAVAARQMSQVAHRLKVSRAMRRG